MSDESDARWAWAEVDLDAIAHNVTVVAKVTAPASVWAVVKAEGYGHGAVPVARAALDAGAEGLCVALVQEGIELREAGITAPILLLSEQPVDQVAAIVEHELIPTVYRREAISALADSGARALPVHIKVDTGMQRVGAHPDDLPQLVESVRAAAPALRLAGIFTHLAVADEPTNEFTRTQLDRFDDALAKLDGELAQLDEPPRIHAANSAASLVHPAARRTFVRLGIAMYGVEPGPEVAHLCDELKPAMSLVARVAHTKRVAAGSGVSYGLRHTFPTATRVATVPLGYADGVPRRLSAVGGEVLIHGRRCPMVGVVTMDQFVVDCGDLPVAIGDEVMLIGEQGDERITAEDWARPLDTIGYEIVCGVGARVPRRYRYSGAAGRTL